MCATTTDGICLLHARAARSVKCRHFRSLVCSTNPAPFCDAFDQCLLLPGHVMMFASCVLCLFSYSVWPCLDVCFMCRLVPIFLLVMFVSLLTSLLLQKHRIRGLFNWLLFLLIVTKLYMFSYTIPRLYHKWNILFICS